MPTDSLTQSTLPQAPIKPFNANAPSTLTLTPPSQPVVSPIQPQQSQAPVSQGTAQPQTMEDGTQVDPSIVALMHGLKVAEGTNGNYNTIGDEGTAGGIAQWSNQVNGKVQPLEAGQIPVNFQNDAKQYGFDPNDFSPENQNKVLYAEIAAGKAKGLTPEQILSAHNSGDPNKYADPATSSGTGQVGAYNVAAYVQKGMAAAQQYAQQQSTQIPQTPATGANTTSQSPSVGGFLGNVVSSGANFAGNLINAVAHPITTGQNLLETGAGALQEAGGQTNDNTAKFDQLKNYFVNRYGGISNLEHTLYTDPVGFAADLSTVLGTGAGVAGLGAKAAELGGLGEVGSAATETAAATEASGLAGGLKATASALGTGAKYTNPLTPIVAGAGAALNKATDLSDVIKNPANYTSENIANSSSEAISKDVQAAFDSNRADLSETGSAYTPLRNSSQYAEVGPTDLAQLVERNTGAIVDQDGTVIEGGKLTTPLQVRAVQSFLDTWQPKVAGGDMTANDFLDMRSYLNTKLAKFGKELTTDPTLKSVGESMYTDLNKTYRPAFPNLKQMDSDYSSKINNINDLEDGLIYKTGAHKGEIKTSFISSASKAVKNGDTDKLAQLEQIVPGITKRLQVMKTIKDLGDPSFTTSLVEKGGVVGGLLTGNIKGAALALTSIILSKPSIAIPLLRAVGANIELVKTVMANLSKSVTAGAVQNNVQQSTPRQPQEQTANTPAGGQDQQLETQSGNPSDLNSLASNKGFDLSAARAAGYSDQDIQQFLATQ